MAIRSCKSSPGESRVNTTLEVTLHYKTRSSRTNVEHTPSKCLEFLSKNMPISDRPAGQRQKLYDKMVCQWLVSSSQTSNHFLSFFDSVSVSVTLGLTWFCRCCCCCFDSSYSCSILKAHVWQEDSLLGFCFSLSCIGMMYRQNQQRISSHNHTETHD